MLRGSYRKPVSLAAQLLTGVQTRPPSRLLRQRLISSIASSLNIDVKTAEEVVVDNNYGRLDVAANLRIVGTAADAGSDRTRDD